MIELPRNTRIWLVAGVTDMRRGLDGLSAQVENALHKQPHSGHVFIFRGRRGDIVKLLWADGDGLCLFMKRLERGRFLWTIAENGALSLTRAQLSMLLEGIDWRRVERTWEPDPSAQFPVAFLRIHGILRLCYPAPPSASIFLIIKPFWRCWRPRMQRLQSGT